MPKLAMAGASSIRERPIEIVKLACERGFDGAEIFAAFPQAYFETVSAEERREVKRIVQTSGLSLSLHSPIGGPNIASMNQGIREESIRQMVGTVDMAVDTGAGVVVLHNGSRESPFGEAHAIQWALNVDALQRIAAYARERGVRLGLENVCFEDNCIERSYEDMVKIRAEVGNDALWFTFDFGHARLTGSIEAGLAVMGPQVIHVHLTDNFGSKDDHIELGTGNFDHSPYAGFLRALDGNIVLEVIDSGPEGIEKAARSLAYVRRLLAQS